MKRFQILSTLALAGLLACGGKQPATAPSPPEAQDAPEAQEAQEAPEAQEAQEAPEAQEPDAEEKAPEPALSPMHQGPSAWEGDAVGSWIAAVVAQQKKQKKEIRVRVPLVIASDGWGCVCPETFIGADPDSHAGGDTWITVDASKLPEPEKQRLLSRKSEEPVEPDPDMEGEAPFRGAVFLVEGYFPGKRTKVDLRNKRKQPREWLYETWNLRVVAVVGTAEPGEDLFVHSEEPVTVATKAR